MGKLSAIGITHEKASIDPTDRTDELGFAHGIGVVRAIIVEHAGGSAHVHFSEVHSQIGHIAHPRRGTRNVSIHAGVTGSPTVVWRTMISPRMANPP